jgi:hypothetical protein
VRQNGHLTIVATARAPIARAAAWLVLAGLGTGFFLQMYARMARSTGNDLGARLASARILVAGGNPYPLTLPQGHGPYPLTIDALVVPLTWLPLGLAQSLWFALTLGALMGCLLVFDALWRQARGGARDPVLEVRLAVLALALFIPFQNHLRYGQVNLLLLCLTSLFLAFHLRCHGLAAAAALGSAIALKLTPAVFLLYLGRGRSYRMALGVIGWTLLLAVGLPALISPRVLELYRVGWVPEVLGLTSGPVEYEWRKRFTLAAVLTEIWPRLGTVPGLRQAAAAAVLAPLLWIPAPSRARSARRALPVRPLHDRDATPLARERDPSPRRARRAALDLAARGRLAAVRARAGRSRGSPGSERTLAGHGARRARGGPGGLALRRHDPAPPVWPSVRSEPPDDPGRRAGS